MQLILHENDFRLLLGIDMFLHDGDEYLLCKLYTAGGEKNNGVDAEFCLRTRAHEMFHILINFKVAKYDWTGQCLLVF